MPATDIRFRMTPGAEDLLPAKAHPDDAAFDLRAADDATIPPGRSALVPTGLMLELPTGFEAQIRPRSGLAAKHAITVLNAPGTIDAGYRGEIRVILLNAGTQDFTVTRGDRIAQMVIQTLPDVRLVLAAADLSQPDRGDGGFGSTGTR